jgi:DNA modification methylase
MGGRGRGNEGRGVARDVALEVGRRQVFPCIRCGESTDAPEGTERLSFGLCRQCFGKAPDRRPRELNELTGRQWALASRSVEQYPDTRSDKQRFHGACFPLALAKQQIEIYTRQGATVLDPFVGVGTTLDACANLSRYGIGIELNPDFVRIAQEGVKQAPVPQKVVLGDARCLSRYVDPQSVDFVLTSPPYGSLLKNAKGTFAYKWREHSHLDPILNPAPYSDRPEDLGNMNYNEFLNALLICLRETYRTLKDDTYAVWVVKDFRAPRDGIPYVNFHGHFIDLAEAADFTLWDIRIYDQTRYRPLVCLGYPSKNFYLNIGHSYLVTLRKR